MPTFDVVSEVDKQEVRNAIDQAQRELATRFDFKGTDSSIELDELELTLRSSTEDRLTRCAPGARGEAREARRVAEGARVRQGRGGCAAAPSVRTAKLNAGISSDKARELNKFIKELGLKGIQSQTQGEQLARDRQEARRPASGDRGAPRGRLRHPLQFTNFRD